MKNILLILSILFVVLSCSNSSDDDNTSQNESDILGEWIVDKIFENDILIEFDACDSLKTLFFNTDSVISVTYEGLDCAFSHESISSYSIENDEMTLQAFGLMEVCDIVKLNADSLHLTSTINNGEPFEMHCLRP